MTAPSSRNAFWTTCLSSSGEDASNSFGIIIIVIVIFDSPVGAGRKGRLLKSEEVVVVAPVLSSTKSGNRTPEWSSLLPCSSSSSRIRRSLVVVKVTFRFVFSNNQIFIGLASHQLSHTKYVTKNYVLVVVRLAKFDKWIKFCEFILAPHRQSI